MRRERREAGSGGGLENERRVSVGWETGRKDRRAKESEEWASTRPTTRVPIRVLSVMEVDGKSFKR